MPISHTAKAAINEPSDEIDLGAWIFGLSDEDYQACATGHHGAGSFADAHGHGMVNVESVGGHLIVQHYRAVNADPSSVEMYSTASRVYLFHLVPVAAAVRWKLGVERRSATTTRLDLHRRRPPSTRPPAVGPTRPPRPLPPAARQ